MFPTESIRQYVALSFAQRIDELAKAYATEVTNLRRNSSPGSGAYFNGLVQAGVRQAKARIEAWIEIVRAACKEASRPIDNEVRTYMLAEVHNMCTAEKGKIAGSLALALTQSGMKAAPGLEQSLVAEVDREVSVIESKIRREFKIEELKENVKKGADTGTPPQTTAPPPSAPRTHQASDRVEPAHAVPKASHYYWQFLKRFGQECYRSWRKEIFAAVILTPITYLLTKQDKNALENAMVALEANITLFSAYVVFHLIRTPYLLHRERLRPDQRGEQPIHGKFGLLGCFLLLAIAAAVAYRVVNPWVFEPPNITVKSPPAPTITQAPSPAPTQAPPARNASRSTQPASTGPAVAAQPAGQQPVQPNQQGSPSAAPQTQLDRLILEDRNLTPGDRDRLSNALFEYAQFLEQGRALGYKVNNEFAKLNQDRQNGMLSKDVDEHIKILHDMDAPAWAYYKAMTQIQEKWKYYQDQADYIFGDNPYNLGPNALINVIEGMVNYLSNWSKISNKDQGEILNLEAAQQNDFNDSLSRYFRWITECLQRLDQIKQSIQPNGIVQPLPSSTPAPAPGTFTMN